MRIPELANMRPGETLVVPGLGRLTLEHGYKTRLAIHADSIIRYDKKIYCFNPTKKSIKDAMACNRCSVETLVLKDPSGRFVGNSTIDAVEYHGKLDTLIITEH